MIVVGKGEPQVVMKLFEDRRSIRKFEDKPVEEEKLQAVLEAARLAPSWANRQCWSFVVVRDPAVRQAVSEKLEGNPCQKGVAQAPVLIAACADPEQSGHASNQDYYLVDIGIGLEHLMLEAWGQGLGTCWIGAFEESVFKPILGVPDNIRLVAMTPLGYPVRIPDERGRKPLDEIVFYDQYGQK
jgi:nitroreductase